VRSPSLHVLTPFLIAWLVFGQSLADVRPVDDPRWWPAGGLATAVGSPSGVVISMVAAGEGFVLVQAADGTFTRPVSLGRVWDGVTLMHTERGVIAVFMRANPTMLLSQRFDPATGQPLEPPHSEGAVATIGGGVWLGAEPGFELWGYRQFVPDGGLSTFVQRFIDGGLSGAPLDVTAFGALKEFTQRWGAFEVWRSDGGVATTFTTFDRDDAGGVRVSVLTTAEGSRLLAMVPTEHALAAVLNVETTSTEVFFFTTDGALLQRVALVSACWSMAIAANGDDVWLACSEGQAQFDDPTQLAVHRVSPTGSDLRSLVFAGDGGKINAAALTMQPSPRLVFVREFSDVGRGNWRGTYVMPLASDGTSGGEPVSVLPRPSAQYEPSFASREPGVPSALAWNDDRLQPNEQMLNAVRLSPEGELLAAPTDLESVRSDFTSINSLGRFIATDGTGFVATSWNGFQVVPIEWPFDGGSPLRRADLTSGFGIFGPPLISAGPIGYLSGWTTFPSVWVGRPLDRRGTATGPQFALAPTAASTVLDVLFDGVTQLQLVANGNRLVLQQLAGTALTEWGTITTSDAGFAGVSGRLARSGSVLLAAWQTQAADGSAHIFTVRLGLDGGVLDDAPTEFEVASRQYAHNLGDIGVRQGVFYVLGTEFKADGGSSLWVWLRPVDGGVPEPLPREIDDLDGVTSVAAGPPTSDGSLLIAFARTRADEWWGPRVYLGTLGDLRDAGSACGRNSDCVSGRCVEQLCCAPGDCEPPVAKAGLRIYQVCGCSTEPGPLWWLVVLALLTLIRRRA